MAEKPYPKSEYVIKRDQALLLCGRVADKVVEVPRELPCNIILVHGVNDVGTGYSAAEEGLCAGLQDRLFRLFKPAPYRVPTPEDKTKVEADPDDVFFKRQPAPDTNSPVIPFYWGYRELQDETKTVNGQMTDRYGNRLDKDLSKGGGPFGNATSSLPDMWNRGVYAPIDPVGDPLRPVKTGPGRMYMVLAARRLAALIAMIRNYDPKDTVNIVAHSQGCLLSLLAQAFLLEMGQRTADTLILTHPPYSLEEEMGVLMKGMTYFQGGTDAPMKKPDYDLIDGRQSFQARLQTLVNIVTGVAKARAIEPAFAKLNESDCGGMVEARWKPGSDRDNRGKVYLYFCPEDMTVALDNMRGIGWQGVPDYMRSAQSEQPAQSGYMASKAGFHAHQAMARKPLDELGAGFRQRVFTAKLRHDPATRKLTPVWVGQSPHDFALRIAGEDDHAHVAESGRSMRESLPIARWPVDRSGSLEAQRYGIRTINGEPLRAPWRADVRGNQIEADKVPASSRLAKLDRSERGPCEEVDPIDAAIALTASGGLKVALEELPAAVFRTGLGNKIGVLPEPERARVEAAYNEAKNPNSQDPDDKYAILVASRRNDGVVVAQVRESPNAARKRWQQEVSPKSFHSVIFASRENHRRVTAYDVSIGSGKASSDPTFYAYLCAVADWRLKMPTRDKPRKSILTWKKFMIQFGAYCECEPAWRLKLIKGNANYYTFGELPADLPVMTAKLWGIVVSETTAGKRVSQSLTSKGQP
jgi:pimeloyl-ACP methyl ester carboxylesterase